MQEQRLEPPPLVTGCVFQPIVDGAVDKPAK
jgi:hypothetical protein